MRSVLIAMVGVGCGAAVTAPPVLRIATPVAPITLPPAPKPVPAKTRTLERYSDRDLVTTHLSRGEVILLGRRNGAIEPTAVADVAEIDFLGPCVRTFVQAQPETARRLVVEALTHYVTSCRADGAVVLERPVAFDSRDRRSRTDVSFSGVLTPNGRELVLRVVACGSATMFDRITIKGGGESWTSPRVELARDPQGCEVGELAFTRALSKAVRLAAGDDTASVLFDGTDTDLALDEGARDELGSVLAAVDAITPL